MNLQTVNDQVREIPHKLKEGVELLCVFYAVGLKQQYVAFTITFVITLLYATLMDIGLGRSEYEVTLECVALVITFLLSFPFIISSRGKRESSSARLTLYTNPTVRGLIWIVVVVSLIPLTFFLLNLFSPNVYSAAPEPVKPTEALGQYYVPIASDERGNRATFATYILSDEYRWALASTELLQGGRREIIFTDQMKAIMSNASAIICVGTSSGEMNLSTPRQQAIKIEENRAAQRADTIARWVRAALTKPVPVYKLNLGYNLSEPSAYGSSESGNQRRVIIILVLKREPSVNLTQALRQAINENPMYKSILTQYSLFDLTS